jgi:hypothetical protein
MTQGSLIPTLLCLFFGSSWTVTAALANPVTFVKTSQRGTIVATEQGEKGYSTYVMSIRSLDPGPVGCFDLAKVGGLLSGRWNIYHLDSMRSGLPLVNPGLGKSSFAFRTCFKEYRYLALTEVKSLHIVDCLFGVPSFQNLERLLPLRDSGIQVLDLTKEQSENMEKTLSENRCDAVPTHGFY